MSKISDIISLKSIETTNGKLVLEVEIIANYDTTLYTHFERQDFFIQHGRIEITILGKQAADFLKE